MSVSMQISLRVGISITVLVLCMSQVAFAADSFLDTQLYQEKAGVKISDYRYSVPIQQDKSPIVEVHQSDGVFAKIVRDRDIVFKTAYRIECGRGRKLQSQVLPVIRGMNDKDVASYTGTPSTQDGANYLDTVMSNYVKPQTVLPQTMCNRVINDRKKVGLDTTALLKAGFWTKIDKAYATTLAYECVDKKKTGFSRLDLSRQLDAWQPLYVHCLGDKDYGKVFAKTSHKTKATSATHADLKKQLDKKRASRSRINQPVLQYRALLHSGQSPRTVSAPKTLADFIEYGKKVTVDRGFRLIDVEVASLNKQRRYVGLWEKGTGTNIFSGPKRVNEFNKFKEQQNRKGLILVDFELFGRGDNRRVVGIWKSGTAAGVFSPSMSIKGLKERTAKLRKDGFMLVDMEARIEKGEFRYAALWRQFKAGDTPYQKVRVLAPKQADRFRTVRDQLAKTNEHLIDVERIVLRGKTYYTGLLVKSDAESRLSKPRDFKSLETFLTSLNDIYVDDLEVHKID